MEAVRKIESVYRSISDYGKLQKDYELQLNLEAPSVERMIGAQPLTLSLCGQIALLICTETVPEGAPGKLTEAEEKLSDLLPKVMIGTISVMKILPLFQGLKNLFPIKSLEYFLPFFYNMIHLVCNI